MTAATLVTFRNRVRRTDLVWLTVRQHRTMIVGTGALVLAATAVMVLLAVLASARGTTEISFLMVDSLTGAADVVGLCLLGYGGLVATFWAAPLLSREYEQRTHLLMWSQDVPAKRWLAAKTLVLLSIAVAFGLLLGAVGNLMVRQLNDAATAQIAHLEAFGNPYFVAAPLVQAGYVLFGFALGLTMSAISRRTVLSMGLTLGIFFVVRAALAGLVRPYYQTPVRAIAPIGAQGQLFNWRGMDLFVDSGRLDSAGNEIPHAFTCNGIQADRYDCLRERGIVSRFVDFQPIDRLATFHLIEFGVFTALAAALLAVTWAVTRKTTQL